MHAPAVETLLHLQNPVQLQKNLQEPLQQNLLHNLQNIKKVRT